LKIQLIAHYLPKIWIKINSSND